MKAFNTQTTVIKFRYVLNFIDRKLNVCALALGIGIRFAFYTLAATFTRDYLVFTHLL